jgi:hypothetical protein
VSIGRGKEGRREGRGRGEEGEGGRKMREDEVTVCLQGQ